MGIINNIIMKMSKKLKKVPVQHTNELPDCVISYIFSKLNMKDLVKISALSKRWRNEWESRMDLNFDLQNMFDTNVTQDFYSFLNSCERITDRVQLFDKLQYQFVRRIDQFMFNYQGDKIHSLRVDFPLGEEQGDIIDRMISQAIEKGVERIQLLLFSREIVTDFLENKKIKPYQFPFWLISENDSLKYLHLKYCRLVSPFGISGFKKLTTLVLEQIHVKQDLLLDLFSSCSHLVDLTLRQCTCSSDLNITAPKLLHLNLDYVHRPRGLPLQIDINTLNLSSIEYNGHAYPVNLKAPQLSKFCWNSSFMPNVELSTLKKLETVVLDGLFVVPMNLMPSLFSQCPQLEDLTLNNCTFTSTLNINSSTLCHLKIIGCNHIYPLFWKIDIDASNLSSFHYRGDHMKISSVKAPQLLKFYLDAKGEEEIPCAFDLIASLHNLENLTLVMDHSKIERIPRSLGPFQHLRQLEFFIDDETYKPDPDDDDFFWVLDIVMASPNLQKLVLTIKHPHLAANKRQMREHRGFSHNELKYVELRGCAGNINEIELARHFLKNVNSLKRISIGPCGRFYKGARKWTSVFGDCDWFPRGCNLIREMLEDEVSEQCQLRVF